MAMERRGRRVCELRQEWSDVPGNCLIPPGIPTLPSHGYVIIDPNGNVQEWLGAPARPARCRLPPGAQRSAPLPRTAPRWSTARAVPGGWTCVAALETVQLPSGVISLPVPDFVNDADGLDPTAIVNDMITALSDGRPAARSTRPRSSGSTLISPPIASRWCAMRFSTPRCRTCSPTQSIPISTTSARLLGVTRLPAQGAVTTLQFTLAAALPIALTLPAGTLIGTQDGAFSFSTSAALTIACRRDHRRRVGGLHHAGRGRQRLRHRAGQRAAQSQYADCDSHQHDGHQRRRRQRDRRPSARADSGGAESVQRGGSGRRLPFFALGADPSIIDVLVAVAVVRARSNVYILTGPITVQPASLA